MARCASSLAFHDARVPSFVSQVLLIEAEKYLPPSALSSLPPPFYTMLPFAVATRLFPFLATVASASCGYGLPC
mgnify:CR=1 FL=1